MFQTHLWSYEVSGVARRHQQPVLRSQLFGEAEVADADGLGVPALVHVQDVAGLQVSVDHLRERRHFNSKHPAAASAGHLTRVG